MTELNLIVYALMRMEHRDEAGCGGFLACAFLADERGMTARKTNPSLFFHNHFLEGNPLLVHAQDPDSLSFPAPGLVVIPCFSHQASASAQRLGFGGRIHQRADEHPTNLSQRGYLQSPPHKNTQNNQKPQQSKHNNECLLPNVESTGSKRPETVSLRSMSVGLPGFGWRNDFLVVSKGNREEKPCLVKFRQGCNR